jgi:hypothetical protein
MKDNKKGIVHKITKVSGVGMTDRRYRKPMNFGDGLRLQGYGMRIIGGRCCGCVLINDKFLLEIKILY